MRLLQNKDYEKEKLTELVKPLIKSATEFESFMTHLKRCDKIDSLEAMRKELEPQTSTNKTGFLAANIKTRAPQGRTTALKPLTQAVRHTLLLQILQSAQIVCTTLSMSASEMFNNF